MFYLDYLFKNLVLTIQLILKGEWGRVYEAIHARLYRRFHWLRFEVATRWLAGGRPRVTDPGLAVVTDHPVAFSSPDYVAPFGTKYNNSTNRKFVTLLDQRVRQDFKLDHPAYMDPGCSGGQLVADFTTLGWLALGLEGSDYSLKHGRANWASLGGRNLFTCDITKPFQVRQKGQDLRCHLITAWEVLEHIHPDDLDAIFRNIRHHLAEGGFFIASTSSHTSVVDGVELHQTRMTNSEWKAYIARCFPDLEVVDLGLRIYQYVRFDFGEPSHLVYRKKARATSAA